MRPPEKRKAPNSPAGAPSRYLAKHDTAIGGFVKPSDGSLVARFLTWPQHEWRARMRRAPRAVRVAVFDWYYELAESLQRLPWGLRIAERGHVFDSLMDFAWHMNDVAVELNRSPGRRRPPPYSASLIQSRRRGLVPQLCQGVHVSIGMRWSYRSAAPGAYLLARHTRGDFSAIDFSFLAGLHVQIVATAADMTEVDRLGRELAAQGVWHVTLRRLDHSWAPIEVLYEGTRPRRAYRASGEPRYWAWQ